MITFQLVDLNLFWFIQHENEGDNFCTPKDKLNQKIKEKQS